MDDLRDKRELPATLRFLNRTPSVDAMDEEIMAFVSENVIAADILPDDATARVYGGQEIRLELTKLPNIKRGYAMNQAMLNLLSRLSQSAGTTDDQGLLRNRRVQILDGLLLGVRMTMERMIIGSALDSLTYDHNGQQFDVGFNTPSDLKVTAGTPWSDSATATPISDIQTLQSTAREKYGVGFDRLTMTSVAFREMIATAEFRDKATLYSQLVLPSAGNFPTSDTAMMNVLAGRILGMSIEIYDEKYWTETNAGAEVATNFVPTTHVILTSTANDNNAGAMDFANAVVTETIVGQMLQETNGNGQILGGFGAARRGPVAYAEGSLNPANLSLWAVARGFPRKKLRSYSAYLVI